MKNSYLSNQSNLFHNNSVDEDIRDLFGISFTTYKISENYNLIYKNDPSCSIPKRLIELYVKYIKPDYNSMIYSFKKKYISNEILVEKNDSREQRLGLIDVYNYVQSYTFRDDKPLDIFVASLEINSLLWGPTDKKNNEGLENEQKKLREDILRLKQEAKEKRDLNKFKKANAMEKELRDMTHKTKIGGILRSDDYEDHVDLLHTGIDVPKASDAMLFMNSFISPSKKKEFESQLKNSDIISYISYCVKEVTDLIFYQPFIDGNKRTFRALLNLMFKERGLPPVYVKTSERIAYKNALIRGMKDKNYSEIIGFYLFKICDSIYELDVLPYQSKRLDDYRNESNFGTIGDVQSIKKK